MFKITHIDKKILAFPKEIEDNIKAKILGKAIFDISNETRAVVIEEYNRIVEESQEEFSNYGEGI